MQLSKSQLVFICGACVVAGWLLAGTARAPEPMPQPRPAVRWLARIAKTFLWVALAAERTPNEPAENQIVHAHGNDFIQFRQGW